jgi:hypothetical protein
MKNQRLSELRSKGCITEEQYKELLNSDERCEKCAHFHRLKHNFEAGTGFEESNCCDVLLHLPDSTDDTKPSVQEVSRLDRCELFTETKQAETTVTTKQLEEMYDSYEKSLWREHEDVRGDDMVEMGTALQLLEEELCLLGCWDREEQE